MSDETTQDLPDTEQPEVIEDAEPDVETKARDMGWVPEGDFKGDPAKWRPADDYVRRGEEFLPFIKKDRDKFKAEVDTLRTELRQTDDDHKATIGRLEKMSQVALDQQRTQLEEQFAAKKEAAVEVGDLDAYHAADKAEREALGELDKKTAPDEVDEVVKRPPAVDAWLADNVWFNSDTEMAGVASTHHGKLLTEKPGLTLVENLAEVREYVKKRYPEKFSTGSGETRGSPVESGGRGGGNGGGRGLYARLPDEAKEQCDRFIGNGQFIRPGETAEKDMGAARERYARTYFGDEA